MAPRGTNAYSQRHGVVAIHEDGLVTAMKSGETYISVHSAYNPEVNDRMRLRVSGGTIDFDEDDSVDQSEAEARRR